MKVRLVPDLGSRLVGKRSQKTRELRVAKIKEAASHTSHLVMALPGGGLVGDAAGARGAGTLEVHKGEAHCAAEGECEVVRGKGKTGTRGGRRKEGGKTALSRAGEDTVSRNPAVESGRGDRVLVAEAVKVGELEGETQGLLKPGFRFNPGGRNERLSQEIRVVGHAE